MTAQGKYCFSIEYNKLVSISRLAVVKREAQFPFGFGPGFGAGYGSTVSMS